MENSTMTKIIFDYIKKNGGVSFVELEALFQENGFDYKGNLMIATSAPNIIMWLNWNKFAVEVLTEVIKQGAEFTSTSSLIYYIDGAALNLPIAKTAKGYKHDLHWLPVVLNVKNEDH